MGRVQEDSEGLLRVSRQNANRKAEEIIADAEKQAEEFIRQARKQIADEQKLARQEMRDQIVDLAVDMASRILEREVTAEDHKRIVERFLKSERVG
jgi:F-type H+-transporting ATPase subunit b